MKLVAEFDCALRKSPNVCVIVFPSADGMCTAAAMRLYISWLDSALKVSRKLISPSKVEHIKLNDCAKGTFFIVINLGVDTHDIERTRKLVTAIEAIGTLGAVIDEHDRESWGKLVDLSTLYIEPQTRSPEYRSAGEVLLKYLGARAHGQVRDLLEDAISSDELCPVRYSFIAHTIRMSNQADWRRAQIGISILWHKQYDDALVDPAVGEFFAEYNLKILPATRRTIQSARELSPHVCLAEVSLFEDENIDEVEIYRELYTRYNFVILKKFDGKVTRVFVVARGHSFDIKATLEAKGLSVIKKLMPTKVQIASDDSTIQDVATALSVFNPSW